MSITFQTLQFLQTTLFIMFMVFMVLEVIDVNTQLDKMERTFTLEAEHQQSVNDLQSDRMARIVGILQSPMFGQGGTTIIRTGSDDIKLQNNKLDNSSNILLKR